MKTVCEFTSKYRCLPFAVMGLLMWPGGTNALACGCTTDLSVRDAVRAQLKQPHQPIFRGEVVQIEAGHSSLMPGARVTFDVRESWKREMKRTSVVETPSGSCSYKFRLGREYLVYPYGHLSKETPVWTVDQCSLTKPLEQANIDLSVLGEGKLSVGLPPTTKPAKLYLPLISLMIAGSLGVRNLICNRKTLRQ